MTKTASVVRSFKVKIFPSNYQKEEILEFLSEWKNGLNFAIRRIEEEYQKICNTYSKLQDVVVGICSYCGENTNLMYIEKNNNHKICLKCFNSLISEYTMKKKLISTKSREIPPEKDIKQACKLNFGSHYDNLVSQAYGIWRSFNTWRKKREKEIESIKKDLIEKFQNENFFKLKSVWFYKLKNPEEAVCSACGIKGVLYYVNRTNEEYLCDQCFEKFRALRLNFKKLKKIKRVSLPVVQNATARIDKSFFKFADEDHISIKLLSKKHHKIPYSKWEKNKGKEKLKSFLEIIKKENQKKRTFLYSEDGEFFILYPLQWRVLVPDMLPDADRVFITFTPKDVCVTWMTPDNEIKGVEFFKLSKINERKNHYIQKRGELLRKYHEIKRIYKDDEYWINRFEELLNSEKSMKKAKKKIRDEMRFLILRMATLLDKPLFKKEEMMTHSLTHDLSRKIVNHVKGLYAVVFVPDMSGLFNVPLPKKMQKKLRNWPVITLSDKICFKLTLEGIPYKKIKYNKIKRLSCPRCGAESDTSTLTKILKDDREYNCKKCGYKTNIHLVIAHNLNGHALA